MNKSYESIEQQAERILANWLVNCTRRGKISRNTVAICIVVLHHLRVSYPVTADKVLSGGGEITGARSGLGKILEEYDLPGRDYLKEVTTRQAHQDGQRLLDDLEWGAIFSDMLPMDRDSLLRRLIKVPVGLAFEWLDKQNFVLKLDRKHAPTAWIREIVQRARDGESGGVVEQHLVGAKLERRFKSIEVPNHPAHAADLQTGRDGDFVLHDAVYHVTSAPSRNVIQKCAENLRSGKRPILIVPSDLVYKAQAFAEDMRIQDELMILPIEGFISTNILELSIAEDKDFYDILGEIISLYNSRLEAVETDRSLRISLE